MSIQGAAGLSAGRTIEFRGAHSFRTRLLLAALSGRPIRIVGIREDDENPGLRDYEISFLRLLDSISNGSKIKINETGTKIRFESGFLVGGSNLVHKCPNSRAVGYFLEPLMLLAPFCKSPLRITLTGVTNGPDDLSVDTLRVVTLPLLKRFGVENTQGVELALKINKRGAPPDGGGEVYFTCPVINELKAVDLLKLHKIKRVRGLAYTTKVSPQIAARMVDKVRSVFNSFIPDVFVYTDHSRGPAAGNSPGYGLSLVAESITGLMLSAELVATHRPSGQRPPAGRNQKKSRNHRSAAPDDPDVIHEGDDLHKVQRREELSPEDIGVLASHILCQEIAQAGVVDSAHQPMVLLLMALCPQDVSRVRLGPLTPQAIEALRLIREILGVTFKLVEEPNEQMSAPEDESEDGAPRKRSKRKSAEEEEVGAVTVVASAMGMGFKNYNRQLY